MGSFRVFIAISNIDGGDPGATHSRTPESLLYGLRIASHGDADVVLGGWNHS